MKITKKTFTELITRVLVEFTQKELLRRSPHFEQAPWFNDNKELPRVWLYLCKNDLAFIREFNTYLGAEYDAAIQAHLLDGGSEESIDAVIKSLKINAEHQEVIAALISTFDELDGQLNQKLLSYCVVVFALDKQGKNGIVPALFYFGDYVTVDDKFIEFLSVPIFEGLRSVFTACSSNASSKNLFGVQHAIDTYGEYGLFGFSNIVSGEVECDSSVTGGANSIPAYKLAAVLKDAADKKMDLVSLYHLQFMKEDHIKNIAELHIRYSELVHKAPANPAESILDGHFKQIVIPVPTGDGFISVTPLLATQQKGAIGDIIKDLTQRYTKVKNRVDPLNIPHIETMELTSMPQNFTDLASVFKSPALSSSAPSVSFDYAVKYKHWEILDDIADNDSIDELARAIRRQLWYSNYEMDFIKLKKFVDRCIHMIFLDKKKKAARDSFKQMIEKDSVLKLEFILGTSTFENYENGAEKFDQNFHKSFFKAYNSYLKTMIAAFGAKNQRYERFAHHLKKDGVLDEISSLISLATSSAVLNFNIKAPTKDENE